MSSNIKISCIIFSCIFLTLLSCTEKQSAPKKTSSTIDIPLADDILLKDYQPIEVMLLGTWHFAYYNFDSHKTKDEDMIDFTSEKRQAEMLEVVQRLENFKPTIICLEDQNQHVLDSTYRSYLTGNRKLLIDEAEQLGFRVAKNRKLNKLHAVDTYSWLRENYDEYSPLEEFWDDEYYLDTLDMNSWAEKYDEWYNLTDKFPSQYTLDEALRIENHPTNIKRSLGHYLIQMKTSNDNGPDAYALKWYDRNVRIFNNILKTNPKEGDRILIIYGASHVSILEQLFDVSPQFKVIRPYDY